MPTSLFVSDIAYWKRKINLGDFSSLFAFNAILGPNPCSLNLGSISESQETQL